MGGMRAERERRPRITRGVSVAWLAAAGLAPAVARGAAGELPPIERVEIRPNRAIAVNGRPFFPRMAWLQKPGDFDALRACGINTMAGYWPGSGGTKDVKEYLDRVWAAGFYGVMPFDERLEGHPALLGTIHGDEPDLPHGESDAEVAAGPGLRVNPRTPLWKMVDGDPFSWSVLDPLEGATVTIRLETPFTVARLAVSLTISPGLSVAKEIAFEGEGEEILRARLEARKGVQSLDLHRPATFRTLTLRVLSTVPGKEVWGSIGEVEGLDRAGENVLLCPPYPVPRKAPAETLAAYRAIKAGARGRPVFMTLTGYFHPFFKKWDAARPEYRRETLYPRYIAATDIVGYDIYPIYGWNKPEWIHLVHDATELLVGMAGGRPVYAWIETSKGGKWTGPLARQEDVTPAHIRAEVWMAITGGATAIGYFTHIWKPAYRSFGVPQENREALARINDEIRRLTPILLSEEPAPEVRIESPDGVRLDAMARVEDGNLTIFAVNYDEKGRGTRATLRAPGIRAGAEAVVVGEGRAVRCEDGRFTDDFGPLAVRIYQVRR